MKTSFSLVLGLGLACAAPMLAGCGGEDAEGDGAKYPQAIGYDAPLGEEQTGTIASTSAQPPPAIPAQPPPQGDEAPADDVAVGADPNDYEDTDPSALTDFHSALDPYGSWVDDPTYGTVWEPSPDVVGDDFTPYQTAGSWNYDDTDGYVWASDYDWGWAPFHYGRWAYMGTRWGWIPGRTYAGAWVGWRYGGGYVGWAPLPPTYYWRNGMAFGLGVVPYAPYSFCGYHDVFQPHFGGHLVTGGAVGSVAQGTRPYTPANPTVGGTARTPAHPTVGGSTGGPAPQALGLGANEVARAPMNSAGLSQARAFAHPSTAQALGAHAPMQSASRASASFAGAQRTTASTYGTARLPSYGRNSAVASAPRYNGVAPAPYHSPSYSSRGAYSSYGSGRAYGSYSSYGSPHASSPYYSSGRYAPMYGGAYRGGAARGVTHTGGSSSSYEPGYSTGGAHGGGFRGGGGFHGGGGHGGGGHR